MGLTRRHDPFSPHVSMRADPEHVDPLDRMWDELGDTPLAQRVHAAVHEVSAEERNALAAVLDNAPHEDIVALVDYWLEDLGQDSRQVGEVLAGTVPEVEAYADAHPELLPALIAQERAGKNRTTLLTALEHREQQRND